MALLKDGHEEYINSAHPLISRLESLFLNRFLPLLQSPSILAFQAGPDIYQYMRKMPTYIRKTPVLKYCDVFNNVVSSEIRIFMPTKKTKNVREQQNQSKALIRQYGVPFSSELEINLQRGSEKELFKWFLASILYGKRISYHIAAKTYDQFKSCNVLTPQAIADTGWEGLVKILDDGGYVRYDYSTASKLLEIVEQLQQDYGTLTELHKNAKNPKDLENKIMQFKGVGPVTMNIFLRELRNVWKKADPEPLQFVKKRAAKLGITLGQLNRKTKTFIKLESALIRSSKP